MSIFILYDLNMYVGSRMYSTELDIAYESHYEQLLHIAISPIGFSTEILNSQDKFIVQNSSNKELE